MPKSVGYGGTKAMKAVGKTSKGAKGTASSRAVGKGKVKGGSRNQTGAVVSRGKGTTSMSKNTGKRK